MPRISVGNGRTEPGINFTTSSAFRASGWTAVPRTATAVAIEEQERQRQMEQDRQRQITLRQQEQARQNNLPRAMPDGQPIMSRSFQEVRRMMQGFDSVEPVPIGSDVFDEFAPLEQESSSTSNNNRMSRYDPEAPELKEAMKQRHLSKNERQHYHKPKPDITPGGKGEVCKNACSLEIDDICSKFVTV